MSRKVFIPIVIFFTLAVFGCSLANPATPQAVPSDTPGSPSLVTVTSMPAATNTPLPVPSDTPLPTLTASTVPSDTPAPTHAASAVPSDTPLPTANLSVVPMTVPASSNYIDDRSTPSQVIVSLYNAIKRKEYLRAYSYWDNPADSLGSFSAFANGYQDTASVELVFGQITGDPGMSQVYYTVPVILKVTATNATRTNYAACYVVHKTTPSVYGAPPFGPIGINRGSAAPSALNVSDASVLATACQGYPAGSGPVPVSANPLNIDKNNFLDNRSGPVETVSSFLNALNLKEYVRAYYYFQDPTAFPGPYDAWAAGYADTDVITVTFGTVQSEGAAGSLYYKVPLAEKVLTTSNTRQTFVGCYTLRLTQPAVQGTPPFQPMGIISGKFSQVADNADVNALLPVACN